MQLHNKKLLIFSLLSVIAFQNTLAEDGSEGIDWNEVKTKAGEKVRTAKNFMGTVFKAAGNLLSDEQQEESINKKTKRAVQKSTRGVENKKEKITQQAQSFKQTAENEGKKATKKFKDAVTPTAYIKSQHLNDVLAATELNIILNFFNTFAHNVDAPQNVKSFFDGFAKAGQDNQTLAIICASAAYKTKFNKWINYNFNPERFCMHENIGRIFNSMFVRTIGEKISSTKVGTTVGKYMPESFKAVLKTVARLSATLALWTGEKELASWAMVKINSRK